MSRRQLSPNWTAAREAWLLHLAEHQGAHRRGRGPVGYHCMRFGWTRWVSGLTPRGQQMGEALTDAGREVLARWERGDRT